RLMTQLSAAHKVPIAKGAVTGTSTKCQSPVSVATLFRPSSGQVAAVAIAASRPESFGFEDRGELCAGACRQILRGYLRHDSVTRTAPRKVTGGKHHQCAQYENACTIEHGYLRRSGLK